MYEAKTKFSKICRPPEEKKEDAVIISRNGKPVLKVTLSDSSPRQKLFGAGKGSRNSVYKCPKHLLRAFCLQPQDCCRAMHAITHRYLMILNFLFKIVLHCTVFSV